MGQSGSASALTKQKLTRPHTRTHARTDRHGREGRESVGFRVRAGAPQHQGQAGRQRDRLQDQENDALEEAHERFLLEAKPRPGPVGISLRWRENLAGEHARATGHGGQRRDRCNDPPDWRKLSRVWGGATRSLPLSSYRSCSSIGDCIAQGAEERWTVKRMKVSRFHDGIRVFIDTHAMRAREDFLFTFGAWFGRRKRFLRGPRIPQCPALTPRP